MNTATTQAMIMASPARIKKNDAVPGGFGFVGDGHDALTVDTSVGSAAVTELTSSRAEFSSLLNLGTSGSKRYETAPDTPT
jgi:hypothetical protein